MSSRRGLVCRGGCEARFLNDPLEAAIATRNDHELLAHDYTHHRPVTEVRHPFGGMG